MLFRSKRARLRDIVSGLNLDGKISMHDGDGRNVYFLAHHNGSCSFVDNHLRRAIGFNRAALPAPR